MRTAVSAFTNYSQACVGGLSTTVGAYEKNQVWMSNALTQTFFFTRFKEGMHRRVGEMVKPDEPITMDMLVCAMEILESRWIRAAEQGEGQSIDKITLIGAWLLLGFCLSFRGEEMPKIELAGTREGMKNVTHHVPSMPPHVKVALAGRTKNKMALSDSG